MIHHKLSKFIVWSISGDNRLYFGILNLLYIQINDTLNSATVKPYLVCMAQIASFCGI